MYGRVCLCVRVTCVCVCVCEVQLKLSYGDRVCIIFSNMRGRRRQRRRRRRRRRRQQVRLLKRGAPDALYCGATSALPVITQTSGRADVMETDAR